ncbi:uncharacterized protein LOC132553214 [Ylistrum balloti]|uniref:uncharacterized protein LOC132553214 n=1 Tax=Ylistrum balloti TaxID=509963 RepID=UPI0029059F43|nr:uncharacterized protein LOC132553214 [Ylistrum balloti]
MDDSARGQIRVKATLKETHIRNINSSSKFEDVKNEVQSWFPFLANQDANLDLVYNDDGDEITISTEEEWKETCERFVDRTLGLRIRASSVCRRKPSFSESTKSGCSTVSILQNIVNTDNSQLTNTTQVRKRLSSNVNSEVSYQMSSIVTQASDDVFHRQQTQQDIPLQSMSPLLHQETSSFSFSRGQVNESDEDNVDWPPHTGDTLDKVKVKRGPNSDTVDSTERTRDTTNSYPCDKKGRVLIFNNKRFPSEPEINGDFDTTCLCLLFKDLKYDVKSYTDQSVQQIREKLDREKDALAKKQYSCYIVFILTHYNPHTKSLSGSKGERIQLEEITDRLNEEARLVGVPKLVFIDGVRHDIPETFPKLGSVVQRTPLKTPLVGESDSPWRELGVDSTDSCPSNTMDDFYIYMAGTLGEGKPIYKGSLMLQALVKVFCESLHKDSLQEMMVKVEQLLGEARTKSERFKMPELTTDTLKKKVYFSVNI